MGWYRTKAGTLVHGTRRMAELYEARGYTPVPDEAAAAEIKTGGQAELDRMLNAQQRQQEAEAREAAKARKKAERDDKLADELDEAEKARQQRKVARSAETGEYVTDEYAEAHPATTYHETVE